MTGLAALWLCRHCRRRLWWKEVRGNERAQLVDGLGRRHCRPMLRHRFAKHEMTTWGVK